MDQNLSDYLRYAESFLGTRYIWAAKNPSIALDCSGFAMECLRSIGLAGIHEVLNAQGMFDKYSVAPNGEFCQKTEPGALIFFGKDTKNIHHVGIVTSPYSIIEAAGGDETTVTINMSIAADARVKKRGINYRSDFVASVMPNWPW